MRIEAKLPACLRQLGVRGRATSLSSKIEPEPDKSRAA